ncbi:3-keto-disaccharide hydrolase [Aquabacterium sp. OR-4]|uniref:3-keto-disaccharide hydrolase n=1 Tax=Aquabacterium sp. OR-4 TaxID=2978127 RepID=UPI0028C87336|nr:DUF1080 domain-containing protein [Aquabacterium sp. OR-4]MDT7838068.1 DUF1080 domain-containing protein [Aquabacterium sp. OR-4]
MPLYRRQLLARSLGLATAPLLGAGLAGCATTPGWTTLLDGPGLKDLNDWSPLGQGRWKIVDGTLEGRGGTLGYLLTREAYADFELRCEFWADADCNSGLFLRCQDRAKVNADNAYEVNIFDKRPDPSYGTAAIVNVAKVAQPGPKAADRWNSFEVTARADRLVVVFNGQQTVDVRDARFRSGPIALQSAGGVIRFRRLQIRTL